MKGNHDYWWTTKSKMDRFLEECGFDTLTILHNNAISAEGVSLCGSPGWMFEQGQEHDKKLIAREGSRIRASLQDAARFGEQEKILFLHYPPIFMQDSIPEFFEVMQEYGVRRCYYGHIHSNGCRFAFQGRVAGSAAHDGFGRLSRIYAKKDWLNRKLLPATGGITKKNVL